VFLRQRTTPISDANVKIPMFVNVVILSALFCAGDADAQSITVLPADTWVMDITPDGEVVVGNDPFLKGNSFIWRWRVDPAPTVIPGGNAFAVSDDGTVIAGNFLNGTADPSDDTAAIWTAATGWQSLGALPGTPSLCGSPSSAYDISGDGTTVVGLAWTGSCTGLGFRWTAATGMVPLQSLANGSNRCSAISGDGSALGGFAQGNFSRTPAYWQPDGSGSVLNPNFQGEVHGFTENGGLSVGTLYFSGNEYSGYVRNQQTGVVTELGKLHATGWAGQAWDVSEDGQTIVGFDFKQGAREAWVWTPADGIVSMKDRLSALGVTGLPSEFWVALKCSDDGRVIVGGGLNSTMTAMVGYIVELSSPSAWVDLGHGLAGVSGVPSLQGTGALVSGAATKLTLTNAKSNGMAAYVAGVNQANAPFKQGILVPSLDFVLGVPTSPTGKVSLQFGWPAGVPAGFSTYHQLWVLDAAGPAGYAASNAIKATTP
jgi:uncharacterized membrane protein